MELVDVGSDTDDCRVFSRVSFRAVKGGKEAE
jgi:hypothetical protein